MWNQPRFPVMGKILVHMLTKFIIHVGKVREFNVYRLLLPETI